MKIRQVLIVDDNPNDRTAAINALRADRQVRYAFHEVATGVEALAMLEVASESIDLVILDYRLKDMHADAIVSEITRDNEIPKIPIILLTGSVGTEARSSLIRSGVQDYFSKSAVTAELLPRIADNAIARHRLMRQLYESEQAAAAAREEAERASRVKSQFLTSISHELRTPLTAILGFTELVRRNPQGPDADRMLEMMGKSGVHLSEILDDLIDIAKIEAETLQIAPVVCDFPSIIKSTCDLLALRASDKGLRLSYTIDPDAPTTVRMDPVRFRQVLINLLNNAIKFTDRGEIVCEASCEEDDGLVVRVTDTGTGIAPETAARIFTPFVQGSSSAENLRTGVGLGLAISKRLAQMMGGDLEIEQTSTNGTTFVFTVKAPCSDNGPSTDESASHLANSTCDSNEEVSWLDKRILLAEDTPANQFLICKLLEPSGVAIDLAENGEVAVQKVVAQFARGEPYDLILMDMQMPVLTGYEAVTQLARLGHRTPIIAVTAAALNDEKQRCLQAGCCDVVTKPIDFEKLINVARRHLS
ncbi:Aerobic respiration control sensor protein ArcB [Botrimarina colliarenosi]|uniref:histidine kinase n=1 Tax=Botrimarina colliarenosi TaxID=2528001 RepID=A0A5C6AL29_9BACT|nr:hybrid sensor histidine kinase/response regulator [Botrimarina colliarenosi]TWT99968.1 Aerobic respiration control sensor protein ArcB [Botrimarina colliarenosi]